MPETATIETSPRAGVLSPEGLIMMSSAIFADVGEFLVEFIPVVGQVLSILIDIGALLFIGGWMYFRSGTIKAPKKTAAKVGKVAKWAKRSKWLKPLCAGIEMLPIGSSILPLWIVAVYLELKYG